MFVACIIRYMRIKNKQKVEVYLTDAGKETLQIRANDEGRTMAEIVKRALDLYYKHNG